jgi:PAS domain S-box-containing protein
MRLPYVIVVISLALWLSALIAEHINNNFWWELITGTLKYTGICGLCYSVLWLGYVYWRGIQPPVKTGMAFGIPAVLSLIVLSSGPLHGLFEPTASMAGTNLSITFIIIFVIFVIYVVCGLTFCLIGISKQYHDRKILALLFCAGLLLPVIASLLFILDLNILPFDVTALISVFSSVLFAYSAMHYQLLDILPIARREIFHEIESALVITRNDGMIIDCNQAFAQIYDSDRKSIIGKDFSLLLYLPGDLTSEHNSLISINKELTTALTKIDREIKIQTNSGLKHFEVIVQPIYGRKKLIGRLYRLTDLSREKQLRQMLSDQNKQLESANQSLTKRAQLASDIKRMTIRNQLARELHDQLGHTIIMTISALEKIERMPDDDNRWLELENLRDHLIDLLQRTSDEDNAAIDENQNVSRIFETLKQENQKSGLVLVTDIQGNATIIPAHHNHDILQICREAITNAVKHGKAGQVNIFLKIADSHYDLIIVDDGNGNPDYSTGFGLTGMQKRVQTLKGNIKIQSDSGGFAIFIKIPLIKS